MTDYNEVGKSVRGRGHEQDTVASRVKNFGIYHIRIRTLQNDRSRCPCPDRAKAAQEKSPRHPRPWMVGDAHSMIRLLEESTAEVNDRIHESRKTIGACVEALDFASRVLGRDAWFPNPHSEKST